ncbi:MAG: heavy metal translocating P-type ATPase [Candidatus Krumholzibacteriia bacterium]
MSLDDGIACGCGDSCAAPAAPSSSHAHARARWDWRGRLTALSGLLLVAAFIAHQVTRGWRAALEGGSPPLAATLLYGGAVLAGLLFVLPRAWRSLARLRPDMNLLMTIAVLGAVALGALFEAAAVSFLFAFSLVLESWSVGRARRAIARLLEIAPETARLLDAAGAESAVAVERVDVGARIRVLAGERIPLDGEVVAGRGGVDQSPLTGESLPVAKAPGDAVYAGCINGEGVLEIAVTHTSRESLLARILREVEEARGNRAQAERWVDGFARVYTPIMLGVAALIALVPPLVFGGAWSRWIYEALVILVIACPCALVISTPVSIVAGLARAAREGVLIKGGVYLELPARLKAMAFDKTGTLSRGELEIARVSPAPESGLDETALLGLAARLEAHSTHPLATAVREAAAARELATPPAEDMETVPGRGLTGHVDGRAYWIGSPAWMGELGRDPRGVAMAMARAEAKGHSLLLVADEIRIVGLLAARDALRPEAAAALGELARLGIRHQEVLSGDGSRVVETLGPALRAGGATPTLRAELLPDAKARALRALAAHGPVAMVGDGINDAPALAAADLGIAMGAMGADAAIETADIALMSDDLAHLPWLVRHSRRVLGIIRQNLGLALGLKLIFLALALADRATLWMAIVADMGASLLVIANALRLLRAPGATRLAP